MKKLIVLLLILVFTATTVTGQTWRGNKQNKKLINEFVEKKTTITDMSKTIYQFKVRSLSGDLFDFAYLKGKKILIVNTASNCGLTAQYSELENIYEKFKNLNFVIVGFPANNFGGQEPGTNQEIAVFCSKNYGVSFPMMSKISVKGSDMHELYQYLTQKSKNGLQDSKVEWNFQKYLINQKGYLEKVIAPQVLPNDKSIIEWINKN